MSLNLDNVTVTVPDGLAERTILDRVSLSVEPGEIVALTGASGSGKSTLLAVAALLMVPQTGRITVAGTNASEAGDKQRTALRRHHIGVIYQSANLFPSLTAREQLHLTAHVGGHLDSAARQRADELLDHVGLTSRAGARPAELSGGERQRVGIARALMGRPSVLLADEPTAALDSERGEAIMALLAEQAEAAGAATMVVTHVPEQLHATRTLSIADGRVSELMAAQADMPKITGDSIAEHVAAQETAVIGATVALFAERGAVNVTMADIAGEVGLARTSVYRYFPTKGAIVARWFETAIKPIIESGNRIAADDADPQLRLGRWVEAQLTFLAHDEHQAMIAAAHDLDDMPEDVRLSIGPRHRELYASLRRILGELSGPVDDAVVEAHVLMITGLLAGFGDLLDTGMNEARCRAEMQRVARCIAG